MTCHAQLATRSPPEPIAPRDARRRRWRPAACLAVALTLTQTLAATDATAQAGSPDRAAAESLFAEGRELLRAGEYRRACAKLEASQKLEPALGTSLNLADCYEKLGRTASAWAEFKGAAARAQRAGDSLRKQTALERAAALEPRLCRLAIESAEPDVSVLQNGRPLSGAVFGNTIPIDPGSYRFEASAPGKLPWAESVEIQGEGALTRLRIPALAAAPPGQPQPAPEPPPMTAAPSGQRALAWTLGGVGVAGLATGAVFGVLASSSWKKAEQSCADYPYECTIEGIDHANTAGTRADVATAAFIVGAAALGTSVVLFAFDSGTSRAELALDADRLALRGRF
jgi:hypothetical protein